MRKNLLLGTSALVAGGLLAADYAMAAEEPLRLDVRGYRNEFFGIGNIDHDTIDYNNTGHFSDGEVHFRGETTLDNGITVGVQVELEAFSTGDQIDENYAFIHGSFGRLVLGSENTAPYQGFWSVTAPSVGIPINSGWITTFLPPGPGSTTGFRTPVLTTNLDIVNDDNIISYYTPRFSGFQLSASYVPTALIDGDGKNFPIQANEDTERHNGFAVGLHYTQSFNAFDFTWAGAFNYIGDCDGPCTGTGGGGDDDIKQYKTGINFGFAGVSLGGSFAYEDSDRATDGWSADAGVSYSTGPWGVSATGFYSEVEGDAGGGEDELLAVVGAVSYALGPGISVSGSVLYGDWDGGDPGDGDADGIMFISGISISY
jgi:predicted porin